MSPPLSDSQQYITSKANLEWGKRTLTTIFEGDENGNELKGGFEITLLIDELEEAEKSLSLLADSDVLTTRDFHAILGYLYAEKLL
jgi:hypothetical protein